MGLGRGLVTTAAVTTAAALALAPSASAATTYRITTVPPIGTVYANNLVTLGVSVGPVPTGADATTPVALTITEPDGDTRSVTMPLTLGVATVATPIHEAGRYVATFTFDPAGGDRAEATVQFDAVPSPLGSGSAS
ncbi:hypothetical protein GCM10023094_21920 [Rhodococcus olei]|uniref:CopC domain-containing protein n=1 Tax=Rhodococcus olei TaxID=2161675 RepID=A0ABP8P2V1_9NOCA